MNTEGTASPNPGGSEPARTPGDDLTGVQSNAEARPKPSLHLKNALAEAAHRTRWRPFLDKVSQQGISSDRYAVPTWFVLVLLVGLYGWLSADHEQVGAAAQ